MEKNDNLCYSRKQPYLPCVEKVLLPSERAANALKFYVSTPFKKFRNARKPDFNSAGILLVGMTINTVCPSPMSTIEGVLSIWTCMDKQNPRANPRNHIIAADEGSFGGNAVELFAGKMEQEKTSIFTFIQE